MTPEERLDRLESIVESNAKSIQALTENVNEATKEWRKDRRQMYQWMSRLAAAQADFYEVQADYLHHIERIDDRLTEILNRLTPKGDTQ